MFLKCHIIVATRDEAKELSTDPKTEIQIISYGFARVKPMFMGAAPISASSLMMRTPRGYLHLDLSEEITPHAQDSGSHEDKYDRIGNEGHIASVRQYRSQSIDAIDEGIHRAEECYCFWEALQGE